MVFVYLFMIYLALSSFGHLLELARPIWRQIVTEIGKTACVVRVRVRCGGENDE
jgi:hypothetical protein